MAKNKTMPQAPDEPFLLKLFEHPCDCNTGCASKLSNFFMGEAQANLLSFLPLPQISGPTSPVVAISVWEHVHGGEYAAVLPSAEYARQWHPALDAIDEQALD